MSDRRSFLKTGAVASAATAMFAHTLPLVHAASGDAPGDDGLVGHGDFRYRVHKEWTQVNPFRIHLDNCHEMVQDSKGRLVMVGDDPRNNIIVFDKSGKILNSWGTYWPGGHGLTLVNEGGDDVLFVSESGWARSLDDGVTMVRQNGYVAKMTLDGRMIFTISHPMTVGAYTPEMLFQPTETAIAPNGDIYIADGYGSDFILRYDQNGKFIQKFGGRDNKNKNYNLANAHGVAFDNRDSANPRLIVTSRGQKAFKYFSLDGKWLKTVPLANLQICRPVIHGEHVYAGVCWSHSFSEVKVEKPWLYQSGFTMVMDKDDRVVSCPGGEQPVYENGVLQRVQQDEAKTFYHGHDVCIDEDENVYVCQWNGERTAPVKLERV